VSNRLLRVVAVGDLMLGDSPTSVGFGFRSRHDVSGLSAVLESLESALSDGDIVFGNLETPLSDLGLVHNSWASFQLRGKPAYASALREAGFTILSVANNHAAQHGREVFEDSIRTLANAGILACGLRGSPPWACEPVLLDVVDTRAGVLAYCLRPRQYGSAEPAYAEGTEQAILDDVRRLRGISETVLVSLHWGEEFVAAPSTIEVELGRSIIDAGATMVIGHHPHVVRPVERYRHGVIAYSLGNCVSDMVWYEPLRHGAALSVDIENGTAGAVRVTPTTVTSAFSTVIDGPPAEAVSASLLVSMSTGAYAQATHETVRRQRLAAYRYALGSVWRFPPRMLLQLLARTARNKIVGVGSRKRTMPRDA